MSDLLPDPIGGGGICRACGAYQPTLKRARECKHVGRVLPDIPGENPLRTHIPTADPAGHGPTTYSPRPRYWARRVLAVFLLLAALALVASFALAVHSAAQEVSRVAPGCGVSCVPVMWHAPDFPERDE